MKPHAALLLALFLALSGFLPAREPMDATKAGPPLRMIAVGEPPPFRQEVRGDRRVELEAEKGSLPPRQILLPGQAPVSLALCQSSTAASAPAAVLDLKDSSGTWTTLNVPENLHAKPKLALFWRDPGKSWSTPHSLLVEDGAEAFPAGKIRFINLLPTRAAVRIGADTHEIAAGKTWLQPAPAASQTLQIAFQASDGTWMPVHSATLDPAQSGIRTEVIIFRADTATARRPAKALVLRDAVPPPAQERVAAAP